MKVDKVSTGEREALTRALVESDAYRLAYEDVDFLESDDLRSVRLQLELLKPEHHLRQHKVNSTVVVFGSARLKSPARPRRFPRFCIGT